VDAQRRLRHFAETHAWGEHVTESFADRAEIFDDKARFDQVLKALTDTDPAMDLPATFSAALENRVLLCVSPELYGKNFPEGIEEKSYEKLMTHEMAHRLHIRILDGNEEAMGPVWFFEGFAIYAAGQFEDSRLDHEEIWHVIQSTDRGSYKKYGAVIRYLLERIPIHDLVAHAGDNDFVEWLGKERTEKGVFHGA
jgi:hypothetical protein